MNLNIINEKLFPFINVNLMKEVREFGRESRVAVLKFAKHYNLQYVGELAERWHERNIVKNHADLLGLILGISDCWIGTFLYDQKKRFIQSVCEYLKTNWSPTAAAAILHFGRNDIIGMPELANTLETLIRSDVEFSDRAERILVISLLSEIYAVRPTDRLRGFILKVIDGLQFCWTNIHEEYPLLLLLSEVYVDLQKPSAKEFKTKGMSRMLQVIHALRTKEVSQEQDYHLYLGTERDVIPTLNFYLAYLNTPYTHSITGPGFVRIKERFIENHFMSERDVPNEVVEILDKMIRDHELSKDTGNPDPHPLQFLLNRLIDYEKPFPNRKNLKLLVSKAHSILMSNLNKSYIQLLQEDVVEESQRAEIISRLLTGPYNLSKEQFEYLEDLRTKLDLTITVNSTYVENGLKYGCISLENVNDLEARGMLNHVIDILKRQGSFAELVSLLERVKVIPYHKFLTEGQTFNDLKTKMDDDLKKRLYPMYLNALMIFRASEYAMSVFKMLQTNELAELFGLSADELNDIERQLYVNNLLPANIAKSIRGKYMSPEELETVLIQELCQELQATSRFSLSDFAGRHWRKISEYEPLRKAFIEKLITAGTKDRFDMGGILMIYYQLRARDVFTQEEIKFIDEQMMDKVKRFNFD